MHFYLFAVDGSFALRLVEVRIPNYVVKGSTAQLECLYDLDGETLYSVKWYKDGNEFYRYVPRDLPPAQTFVLPGVSVNVSILAFVIFFTFFSSLPPLFVMLRITLFLCRKVPKLFNVGKVVHFCVCCFRF